MYLHPLGDRTTGPFTLKRERREEDHLPKSESRHGLLVCFVRLVGGVLAVVRDALHAGELVADAVLLVVELAVLDEEAEDDGRDRENDGDDEEDVDVVVVGVDDAGPLRGSDGVGGEVQGGAGVDLGTRGSVEHGQILVEVAGEDVGLDGSDDGVAASASDLGEKQEVGSDGGNVLVADADLGSDLKGDAEEATAETLEDLREDGLNVGGASLAVLDHEADADHADDGTGDEDPLVVLGAERDEAGGDAEDGEGERLAVGEVAGFGEVVVHDDHGPGVGGDPGGVEAEEVKEADGGGKVDVLVEPPASVEDGLGSEELPDAEADDHDAAEDEHGDDPAGLPSVGLELGEVEGEEEEEETAAEEEEAEGVDVDEESPDGASEGHALVRVSGDETLCLCPPLVDEEDDDDEGSGDGSADGEEARAPSPVDGDDFLGDLGSGPEVEDVGKADEADGDASPLGGDVVGEDDLLHDLDAGVADGVENGAAGDVASCLSDGDDNEAEDPEDDGGDVGGSATEDVGEFCDGELADGDEDGLDDTDGGVGGVVAELHGGGGLPCVHSVVVEAGEVSDEGDAEDADPEGPVGHAAASLCGDDADLLVIEGFLGLGEGGLLLDALDNACRVRHGGGATAKQMEAGGGRRLWREEGRWMEGGPRCRDTREEAMRVEPDETFFLPLFTCSLLQAQAKAGWHAACEARKRKEEQVDSQWGLRRGREDEHAEGQAKNSESELHALHDGRTNLLVGGKEQIRWKRGSLAVARGAQEQCGGAECQSRGRIYGVPCRPRSFCLTCAEGGAAKSVHFGGFTTRDRRASRRFVGSVPIHPAIFVVVTSHAPLRRVRRVRRKSVRTTNVAMIKARLALLLQRGFVERLGMAHVELHLERLALVLQCIPLFLQRSEHTPAPRPVDCPNAPLPGAASRVVPHVRPPRLCAAVQTCAARWPPPRAP
ncbi:hypothetical protein L1887_62966 [Cichorium endivia]|nr:hypothetical protein L1887_62966 [Cichorium endivia]